MIRNWKSALPLALGTVVGAVMLYVGFQHNNQREFFDPQTGTIDVPHSALIFASWAIPITLTALILGLAIDRLARVLRR